MEKFRYQFKLKPYRLLLAVTGFTLNTVVLAQDNGSIEFYSGYLSRDAWRYANIIGENRQGPLVFLDVDYLSIPVAQSSETGYLRIEGRRLGLDTPRLGVKAGNYGSQHFSLQYRGVPTYTFDDAKTPLLGAGSHQLGLPRGWQAGGTTAGLTNLQQSLSEVNLWRKRRTLELDYRRYLNANWTLYADLRRDEVDGMRSVAGVTGATGGNVRSLLLPAPLAYETHIAALKLGYQGAILRLQLGYQGSFFNNGNNYLGWQTPYSRHVQWAAGTGFPDGQNQLALEPDNHAHSISLNGSMNLGGSKRLYFDGVMGRQLQNETLLPYTINPGLQVPVALPRSSADVRVNMIRLDMRLGSRPLPQLNLLARLGYRERDNATPVATWQRVRGDAINQQLAAADARLNRPYSLNSTNAGIDASYRLDSRTRLDTTYEYTSTERDYSEIRNMDEHSLRLGLRSNRFDSLALALDYQLQRRRTDSYDGRHALLATRLPGTVAEEDFENHPLLRKYYLNERDRNQWRVHADWYLSEKTSLGTALVHNKDDYPSGYFGLNDATLLTATLDLAYAPSEDLRLSTFINHDRYRYQQAGRSFRGSVPADAFNAERNWQLESRDRFTTAGISVQRENLRPYIGNWQPAGTFDLTMDLSHAQSSGKFGNTTGADLSTAALPALGTRLDSVKFSAAYHWSPQSLLRMALAWERFASDDFAYDKVEPATTANVLLMGEASPHYQAGWISVSYQYRF